MPAKPPTITLVRVQDVKYKCIPVFTERLFAERWIESQHGSEPNVTVNKLTIKEAIALLNHFEATSFRVAMDPAMGDINPGWLWTVRDAVVRLTKSK